MLYKPEEQKQPKITSTSISSNATTRISMVCLKAMDYLFDDKRLGVSFLMLWLIVVIVSFYDIGLFGGQYMCMGPSPETKFMHITLDTWYKWGLVAFFTAINTCINDFMNDSISPWLLNTLTDHKTKYIQYPKWQCLLISQTWTLYCGIMGIAGIMISLTQIDFVLIRIFCDLMISTYTNYRFMRDKTYDIHRYYNMDVEQVILRDIKSDENNEKNTEEFETT
jgi:hypothetical protein